jgi:hypothetical protein
VLLAAHSPLLAVASNNYNSFFGSAYRGGGFSSSARTPAGLVPIFAESVISLFFFFLLLLIFLQ